MKNNGVSPYVRHATRVSRMNGILAACVTDTVRFMTVEIIVVPVDEEANVSDRDTTTTTTTTAVVRRIRRERKSDRYSGENNCRSADSTRGDPATEKHPRYAALIHVRPCRRVSLKNVERHWQCREVTAQHSFTASPGPAGSKESDETSR